MNAVDSYAPLTTEQHAELAKYADVYGRTWKQSLRDDWMSGRSSGTLHALRNTHGPTWLIGFKL